MSEIIFERIDTAGATGTYDGKLFEVIAESEDDLGNIAEGIVEGDFTFEERLEIFYAWEMQY
jgi:hypothetical protein